MQEADGTFFIQVKELQGCMSVGETITEAYEMIKDAMTGWLSIALEDGDVIPEPEALQKREYSGKFVVRVPKNLHKELAETAVENGISLNAYINSIFSRHCGVVDTKNSIIEKQNKLIVGRYKSYTSSGVRKIKYEYQNVISGNFGKIRMHYEEDCREN